MIRPLPLACALALAAAIGTAWPVSSAHSTGVMTQKQAALRGLVATRKAVEPPVGSLIVKLRTGKAQATAMSADRARALAKAAGVGMKPLRTTAGGAQVLQLDAPMSVAEARAVAARLAQDPTVEYAEPNVRFRALAMPNEPRFTQWQWSLFAPTSSYTGALGASSLTATASGGANLPAAWDLTTGSSDVIVAVIDTGITNHTDLNGATGAGAYVPSGRFLPGYDFVSAVNGAPLLPNNFTANDGDGRDPDPSDPGDWITAAEKSLYTLSCTSQNETAPYDPSDSSWHGSHMAGVLAATANNSVGIAGVAWNVKIVPIRALGKCGGDLDDIADAIRWAAGLTVTGIPANANPAQVISLSLGGGDTCGPTMKAAVDAAMQAGSLVVAATGNDSGVGLIAPANCNGVLAVTAHTINGENAEYANISEKNPLKTEMLSAPGGGPPTSLGANGPTDNSNWDGYYIFSSVLFGPTTPGSVTPSGNSGPAYAGFVGTSPATPHVAGVAALLKTMVPDATPQQIRSFLLDNVRAYPTGSVCAAGGTFAGQCGTGLLDAQLALMAAGPLASPVSVAGADQIVAPASTVSLSSAGSKAYGGKTLVTYEWTQIGGTPTVALAAANTATTTFTAPATGLLTFRLRVTDSDGKTGDDSVVVRVNSPPVVATVAAQTVASGGVLTFNVTGSDADGNALSFVAASGSTVPLTALAPGGTFSWNTAGVPAGTYQLVYFADDGMAQSASQTVAITVTPGSAANPPASGGGGGGAVPLSLLLLGALFALSGLRQRQR